MSADPATRAENRTKSPRVAVIGARGIGKHHAKWFHFQGSDIVAISGADPGRLGATVGQLRNLFPFSGHSYADVTEMLRSERPDVVVVASPPQFHAEHALAAIAHGAHVYVEKPFVWDERRSPAEWLKDARLCVGRARERGLVLAINTQYSVAWESAVRLFEIPASPSLLSVDFGTASLLPERQFEGVWVDVGSHPISILLQALPDGDVVGDSAEVLVAQYETRADFEFRSASRSLRARFRCWSDPGGQVARRMVSDGHVVECEMRTGASGVALTLLRYRDRERIITDLVHESIARFLRAVRDQSAEGLVSSGEVGIRNLEIQLQLAELAQRT